MILRKTNVEISCIEMAPNHNSQQSGESMEAFNHINGFSSITTTHISALQLGGNPVPLCNFCVSIVFLADRTWRNTTRDTLQHHATRWPTLLSLPKTSKVSVPTMKELFNKKSCWQQQEKRHRGVNLDCNIRNKTPACLLALHSSWTRDRLYT